MTKWFLFDSKHPYDLVDDFVVDMLSSIAANGAPLSAQFI